MKYLYTTTIVLLFAVSLFSQQGPLIIDLNHNLNENSGGVFDVEVRVSDFVDLYSVQLFLKWDPDVYRIDDVPYVNDTLPFFDDTNIILPSEDVSIPENGKVRIVWSNAVTMSLPDDTNIVTLRFTALGQPCDESKFRFDDIGTAESERILATDVNFDDIGIEFDEMNVQIPGVGCTSANADLYNDISVNVFPNPVTNILNVDLDKNMKDAKLSLYTLDGKITREYSLDERNNSVSLTDLRSGSYFYALSSSSEVIKRGRLLKID